MPWDIETVNSIVTLTMIDYNVVMKKFTKDTGGGGGDSESFFVWKDKYESLFKKYTHNTDIIYLTIIHIWDIL